LSDQRWISVFAISAVFAVFPRLALRTILAGRSLFSSRTVATSRPNLTNRTSLATRALRTCFAVLAIFAIFAILRQRQLLYSLRNLSIDPPMKRRFDFFANDPRDRFWVCVFPILAVATGFALRARITAFALRSNN
jgi:hypothetical protein